jgi:hypothetical protein
MMWKPGSVNNLSRFNFRLAWPIAFVLAMTACSAGGTPVVVSTQMLIPSTITDTPTAVPPTATPPALPAPQDIVATAPVLIPAIAQSLVSQVMDDLAESLSVDQNDIQLLVLETATWTSDDLGCGDGGQPRLDGAVDGFRLVLLVGNTTYEYHTDSQSNIRRCGLSGTNIGETDLLVQIDPVAAELAALAERRLADELDLTTRRISVVEVTRIIWTDSSLGCPLPGEDYTPIRIDGYRIVLSVDDDQYIFHADFDRLVPCDEQDEVLPPTPDAESN